MKHFFKVLAVAIVLYLPIAALSQNDVTITVDVKANNKPISPYIYGRNNTLSNDPAKPLTAIDWTRVRESGVNILREGHGNNSTKYNWRLKLVSSPDWFNSVGNEDWDYAAKMLQQNCPKIQGMWSFQLLGKAAKSTAYNYDVWGLYLKTGQKAWPPVSSDQNLTGLGEPDLTSGAKNALKEGNTDLYLMNWTSDSTVGILDHWISDKGLNLKKEKIQYWCMDNEPEIWSGTHNDVKPALTAEQYIQNYIKTAKLARAKYPDIKLIGPATCNEWFWWASWGTHTPKIWLEYFIKRIAEEEKASGVKLLDVLDIHFYPGTSDSTKLLQMHRVYFDKTYNFPEANGSSMANGGWDTSIKKEYILERCRSWLTKYFGPNNNIGLGVTECGINSKNPNVQALFYASTMGEFMKNGAELFTPWSWEVGMWEALHLFASYNKSICVLSLSSQEEFVSGYSSINSTSDSLVVTLINRSTTTAKTTRVNFPNFRLNEESFTSLTLKNLPKTETFNSHTKNALIKSTVNKTDNSVNISMAPLSITTLILKGAYDNTVSSPGLKNGNSFRIYPNPAKNELFIESNEFQYDKIEIFDMTGKLIQSQQVSFEPKTRLPISLPAGIYCLKIRNKKNFFTRNFIIE
jgi:hypothetical protein